MMLTTLLFLLLLSSTSVYCALRFQKSFELTLPVSAMGSVLVLFLFGLAGQLRAGVWAVVLLALVLYGLSAVSLLKNRNWRSLGKHLLTPAAAVFFLGTLVYAFLYRGKLAVHWDEFTHWMDIVKVFFQTGDFGTDPAAFCGHGSYPPGMTLFQFLLQELK